MLEEIPEGLKESFLLDFIKEVLRSTISYKSFRFEERINQQETQGNRKIENQPARKFVIPVQTQLVKTGQEDMQKTISNRIKNESEKLSEMKKTGLLPELKRASSAPFIPLNAQVKKTLITRSNILPILRIPEPALPETVSYIRPVPTNERVDIGRLNILVNDPLVKVMECNGAEKNIIVMGMMGRKNTPIKLSKEEIESVVHKFSEAARIPINEGLFKAAVGNLVISAVISEIVETQFIIRKIAQEF